MSIGPSVDSISPTSASVAASSQTSSSRATTASPSSPARRWTPPASRSVATTVRAPPASRPRTSAPPMPPAAPVTTAILPSGFIAPTPYSARAIRGSVRQRARVLLILGIRRSRIGRKRPRGPPKRAERKADGELHDHEPQAGRRGHRRGQDPSVEGRFARKYLDSRELGISYFRYAPASGPPSAIATASRRRSTWSSRARGG